MAQETFVRDRHMPRDPDDINKIHHQFIEIETQRDFLEWIFENLVTEMTQTEAFELFDNQTGESQ